MRAKLRSLDPRREGLETTSAGKSTARDPHTPARDERSGPDTYEWRGSDGPVDVGHYACACGFQFAASVATTVRCPHCGAGQAW